MIITKTLLDKENLSKYKIGFFFFFNDDLIHELTETLFF